MVLVSGIKNVTNISNVSFDSDSTSLLPQSSAAPSLSKPAPIETLKAYNKVQSPNLRVKFLPTRNITNELKSLTPLAKMAAENLNKLKNTDDYSWIGLAKSLIDQKYADSVYSTINEFKKPFGNDTKLILVALGNPANADESANALGLGKNLVYSCDTTLAQVENTIKKAGGDLDKIQIIISSKSGSTFESNQTFKLLTEELTQHYAKKGLSKKEIDDALKKHFLFITDKSEEKSKLKKIANQQGFKTLDCPEKTHSGFADLAYDLPILAYLGLDKHAADKMIKAAANASEKYLLPEVSNNPALQIAAFDKVVKNEGIRKEEFVFHDAQFGDFSSTVEQLYKESLKEVNLETNVYPRKAHSGLEAAISSDLLGQRVNITNVVTRPSYTPSRKEAEFIISASNLESAHIIDAQKQGHFQKIIKLKTNKQGIEPESLGEFLTLKSFVAYYKNFFENNNKINLLNQDFVKGYKKIREEIELSRQKDFE